jgi:O-antigen/teichoic acid export membrane protein
MSLLRSQRFRNFAKNSGMLFLSNKLQAVLLLGQSVIVARSLGVSRYGQWAVVTAFCTLIADFLGFKTGDVLSRYVVLLRKKGNISLLEKLFQRAFILDFLTDMAGLAVILLLSPLVSKRFNGPGDTSIYLFYAISLVLGFIGSCWFALERDQGNFRFISSLSFLRTLSNVLWVCLFFLILKKTNLRFLAAACMLSESMIFLIKLTRIDRLLKNFYGSSLVRVLWKRCRPEELQAAENREFWQFMRINYFSSSISSLVKKIDVLAAGFFFSAADVGLLKMGKSLAGSIQDVTSDLAKPIYQDFNELIASGELGKIGRFLKQYLKYYLAAVFTAILVLSMIARPLISLAYGVEYLPAIPFFRLYLFLVFLFIGFFWMDPLIVAMGRFNVKLRFQLIAFALYLPLLYAGIRTIGIFGIVGAYSIVVVLIFVLMGLSLREANFA